jgi:hypothetical protein
VRAQVNTFITPSGKKICSQATADRLLVKGKVPYFLASEWNRCELSLCLSGLHFFATSGSACHDVALQPLL